MRFASRSRIVVLSAVTGAVLAGGVTAAVARSANDVEPETGRTAPTVGPTGDAADPADPAGTAVSRFETGVPVGVLDNPHLNEISGIAASARYPNLFWVHNDSGEEKARIFLIDAQGHHHATVTFKKIDNRDWEDISVGPGPEQGVSYIYIGDTGNNDAEYKKSFFYRLPEPDLELTAGETTEVTVKKDIDQLSYKYSDGPRDAEAFLVDPLTRDIYIISKRESDQVNLYRIAYPQTTDETEVAQFVRSIPFTEIVGADISRDGREILIKNYETVYYWQRDPAERVESTFDKTPYLPPYQPEPQGEAIAFDPDGRGFYTVSEVKKKDGGDSAPHPIMFYQAHRE